MFCNYDIKKIFTMFDKCLEQYAEHLISSFYIFKLSKNFMYNKKI
jgi:hypothetical protein